jgi:hypothetical protein
MHRRLSACTFDAGLCSIWNQNTEDNFDWTLSSDNEGTPTSNTGPSTGSGGEGAFIFSEANNPAEGSIAAVTSSITGCGLYVDYHMYGGGIGTLTISSRNAADGEDTAWVPVFVKEGDQGDNWQSATIYSAPGYYQVIATRGPGNRGDIAIDNLNLLACTPTAAPTADPASEDACQEVFITTDVAFLSWAVGIWTLDHTRNCHGKPVYYKAVAFNGGPVYASYSSWSGAGYMLQLESALCATSSLVYSSDRTPSDLSEAGSTWRYSDGSSWIVDSSFATSCVTTAPTLSPTYVGERPICSFNGGFCDWTQDVDDNFDWTLTSEGTPTSNTGPSDGAGHGGGAFIHIEANGQTEGTYAAITSSATGCGLYVDYHMYGGALAHSQLAPRMVPRARMQLGCRCGRRREIKATAGRLRLSLSYRAATTESLPHVVWEIVVTSLLSI